MKKNNLISIIVPVYNVENYLNDCLNSILKQSYKNIEIVLIDDGSTDNSYKICQDFAKKYDNIKLIHKENGGLSSARNLGIIKATGKYLTFVDSDDELDVNYIETLYSNMVKYNSDISVCELQKVFPNKNRKACKKNTTYVLNDKLHIIKHFLKRNKFFACGLLLDKKLFKGVEFPDGKYYEDIDTTYKLFLRANSVCYTKYDGYFYFIRTNSISMSHSFKKISDGFSSSVNMYKSINQEFPNLKENIKIILNSIVRFMHITKKMGNDSENLKLYHEMNKTLHEISNRIFFKLILKNKIKYIYISLKGE